jgi:hypothetical protein
MPASRLEALIWYRDTQICSCQLDVYQLGC